MEKNIIIIIGVVILVFVAWWCLSSKKGKKSEGFVPLGALGPYAKSVSGCLDQCNREDASMRMLPQGNVNCGDYCFSVATQLSKGMVDPGKLLSSSSEELCEMKCASSGGGATSSRSHRMCVRECTGKEEVLRWCSEVMCPYSTDDPRECVRMCARSKHTNNLSTGGWTWLYGR